jgi:hypothetical protein
LHGTEHNADLRKVAGIPQWLEHSSGHLITFKKRPEVYFAGRAVHEAYPQPLIWKYGDLSHAPGNDVPNRRHYPKGGIGFGGRS